MARIFCKECNKELTKDEIEYCDEVLGYVYLCSEHVKEETKWLYYVDEWGYD